MNFWKQTTHVLSYFKGENFRGDRRLPSNFMSGFLEVSRQVRVLCRGVLADMLHRVATKDNSRDCLCIYLC